MVQGWQHPCRLPRRVQGIQPHMHAPTRTQLSATARMHATSSSLAALLLLHSWLHAAQAPKPRARSLPAEDPVVRYRAHACRQFPPTYPAAAAFLAARSSSPPAARALTHR